ncbi:FAD-dependent oxidoreductase [Streptomyces sp. NPDC048332]|uniref:FAD-dependent oxidoreductase n=1 Tax=Streptomyces sp. NPDC048332 TaxID=3154619 RepID=UPI003434DA4A
MPDGVVNHVVIVGNGPAAHRLVQRLHHYGHRGTVTVLGGEHRPAYHRPLLAYALDGSVPAAALTLPPLPEPARVRLGVRVVAIDRRRQVVHTTSRAGTTALRYDTLVLATGARPRVPDITGVRRHDRTLAPGVRSLRTLDDCAPFPGATVVVGGGVLGAEAAAALRRRGAEVLLVHPGPHPMHRHLNATVGQLTARWLEELGVEVRGGRTVVAYEPGKSVLDDGSAVRTDHLLLCTGVRPETRLASAAGLAVRTGVVVDAFLRTDDPHIHAIGDCAQPPAGSGGTVVAAWEQAEVLAALLTGHDARYEGTRAPVRPRLPGADLAFMGESRQSPGEREGTRTVTFTDRAGRRYARLTLQDHRVLGAVLFGLPEAAAAVGQWYAQGRPVPSDRLALLLGAAAVPCGEDELPGDAVLCHCNHVTKRELLRAWQACAGQWAALVETTHATTGCGTCKETVRGLCADASVRAAVQTPATVPEEVA